MIVAFLVLFVINVLVLVCLLGLIFLIKVVGIPIKFRGRKRLKPENLYFVVIPVAMLTVMFFFMMLFGRQ